MNDEFELNDEVEVTFSNGRVSKGTIIKIVKNANYAYAVKTTLDGKTMIVYCTINHIKKA